MKITFKANYLLEVLNLQCSFIFYASRKIFIRWFEEQRRILRSLKEINIDCFKKTFK